MNKTLPVIAVALIVVFAAAVSYAGDYHSGANNVCSDCHTMHYSRSHDTAGGTGTGFTDLGPGGLFTGLLRDEPNKLCLACHDGKTDAPDVLGNNTNSYSRSGGALNDTAGTDGYASWTGHTLGSTSAAPGGTFADAEGLECIDCHHQHGSASSGKDATGATVSSAYRNLKSWNDGSGNRAVSYSAGDTKDLTKDVWEAYGHGSTLAQHYGQDNVGLLEPVQTKSGMADYCKSCHTSFHGAKGDVNTVGGDVATGHDWLRHPNADSNIGGQTTKGHSNLARYNTKLYRVRVMSGSGNWGTQGAAWTGAPTDLTPTCLSCHKAHGNKNAFGLVLADGTAAIGEDGNTTSTKSTCTQCHVQGG